MTVRAVLTEYGVPVATRARCRIELTRPDQTQSTLTMSEAQPGTFEAAVLASAQGIYQIRVLAEGQTFRGLPFTREQLLTGAVWRGGDDKPPTVKDDLNRHDDRLCRLISCLLGSKGVIELLRRQGLDPEELRRCLSTYCRKPSPGEAVHPAAATLEGRLRAVVRDESTLRAVLDAIALGSE